MSIEDKLKIIEARADAATPGPWCSLGEDAEVHSCVMVDGGGDPYHVAMEVKSPSNLDFICHSRTDIPALIQAVRILAGGCLHGCTCYAEMDLDGSCGACDALNQASAVLEGKGS